jgi:hypothetical protein
MTATRRAPSFWGDVPGEQDGDPYGEQPVDDADRGVDRACTRGPVTPRSERRRVVAALLFTRPRRRTLERTGTVPDLPNAP